MTKEKTKLTKALIQQSKPLNLFIMECTQSMESYQWPYEMHIVANKNFTFTLKFTFLGTTVKNQNKKYERKYV